MNIFILSYDHLRINYIFYLFLLVNRQDQEVNSKIYLVLNFIYFFLLK